MKKTKLDYVSLCEIQREKNGPWEAGLVVEAISGAILIDSEGAVIDGSVWDFKPVPCLKVEVSGFINRHQDILDEYRNIDL